MPKCLYYGPKYDTTVYKMWWEGADSNPRYENNMEVVDEKMKNTNNCGSLWGGKKR